MYNVDKGPYGPETKKTLTHKMTNNKPIESLQCSKNVGVFYLEEVEAEVKLDQVVHPPRNKCSDKRIKVPIIMTQRPTNQLIDGGEASKGGYTSNIHHYDQLHFSN